MKLIDFCTRIGPAFDMDRGEWTELLRALKEGSDHFDPAKLDDKTTLEQAASAGAEVTPALVTSRPGPGGGLPADPFRATFAVAAAMLPKTRKEIALATWSVWHFNQHGSVLSGWGDDWKPTIKLCPLTGRHLFGDAFREALSNPQVAKRVVEVRVGDSRAEIVFDRGAVSKFESRGDKAKFLRFEGILDGRVVRMIAMLLNAPETTPELALYS